MIPIYFKKLYENATIPTFGHEDNTNAAVDLYVHMGDNQSSYILQPKQSATFSTGVAWYIDTEYLDTFLRVGESFGTSNRLFKVAMTIHSRSGMAINNGIETSNAGIIDEAYSGEIKVKLYNDSEDIFVIHHGTRIAQGKIELLPMTEIKEWPMDKPLPETGRGTKGFGSSGK